MLYFSLLSYSDIKFYVLSILFFIIFPHYISYYIYYFSSLSIYYYFFTILPHYLSIIISSLLIRKFVHQLCLVLAGRPLIARGRLHAANPANVRDFRGLHRPAGGKACPSIASSGMHTPPP